MPKVNYNYSEESVRRFDAVAYGKGWKRAELLRFLMVRAVDNPSVIPCKDEISDKERQAIRETYPPKA
jgi:hypothetical protein